MIQVSVDDSVHPEGCTCSLIEIVKVDGSSIIIKHHGVSPCTLPEEDK